MNRGPLETKSVWTVSRRELLRYGLCGFVSASFQGRAGASVGYDTTPIVVETSHGKVRGVSEREVSKFLGVRYGAPTAGRNRFMPPQAPTPWAGVVNAIHPSSIAYQQPRVPNSLYAEVLKGALPWQICSENSALRGMSEDCLFLNIWTSSIKSSQKRPVMVWLHPGNYIAWAGYSQWTDGTRLAREQDVVLVSLNHRLNVFGFLDLSEFGEEEWGQSGNVGLLDIISALRWVKDNISSFGGDADNVTIFGESGGAGKVSFLLAMPEARGLFHRAVIQSGARHRARERDHAKAVTRRILGRLGINDWNLNSIQNIEPAKLVAATATETFVPVLNDALPAHPVSKAGLEVSKDIPVVLGTNADERAYADLNGAADHVVDEATLREALAKVGWLRPDSPSATLLEAYRREFGNSSPRQTYLDIFGMLEEARATSMATRRVEQGGASSYLYLFNWRSSGWGGRFGACHTFEIPFVFDNLAAAKQLFSGGLDAQVIGLARAMGASWCTFARVGDPNNKTIPHWGAYGADKRETMLIDCTWEARQDPAERVRRAFGNLPFDF